MACPKARIRCGGGISETNIARYEQVIGKIDEGPQGDPALVS
jgi:hypothetical protein